MRRSFFAIFLRFAPCVFWGFWTVLPYICDSWIGLSTSRLHACILSSSPPPVVSGQPNRTCVISQASEPKHSLTGCTCGELYICICRAWLACKHALELAAWDQYCRSKPATNSMQGWALREDVPQHKYRRDDPGAQDRRGRHGRHGQRPGQGPQGRLLGRLWRHDRGHQTGLLRAPLRAR